MKEYLIEVVYQTLTKTRLYVVASSAAVARRNAKRCDFGGKILKVKVMGTTQVVKKYV